ncbi:uncharacterized mitochondrial protein AtMg00810-like [Cryptomeria japonica]|uniref:uncharacterized mitochondrial protein AtMg00810-like n=1 Tax=Cryptomeria japonica TaxID=3369 RepID=UPI0027DA37ED|nr:uncharacterized mitochondrial protein AtMg00810-like [Cryptomeria japonica]
MDVIIAFLNGVIEEVFIEHPNGFVIHEKESHVCRLKKALHGLKEAPRVWYERIDQYLLSLGFLKNDADPNIYFKVIDVKALILVLYIDDLFLTGEDDLIARCKKELASEFEMKDLGLMYYSLGLEVWQRPNEVILSQEKYAIDLLKRFGMLDCKSMATPMEANLKKLHDVAISSDLVDPTMYRQLIGSLMYLVNTRLDICYAVNTLSQFMCETRQIHFVAAKHILRYVRGTMGYGLKYTSCEVLNLQGFSDSDWAGCVPDRKNTSGCCFSLGSATIFWCSRKQSCVAQSTTEVEYVASCVAASEVVWLRKLLAGLFGQHLEPIVILCVPGNNEARIASLDHQLHVNLPHSHWHESGHNIVDRQLKYRKLGPKNVSYNPLPAVNSKTCHDSPQGSPPNANKERVHEIEGRNQSKVLAFMA